MKLTNAQNLSGRHLTLCSLPNLCQIVKILKCIGKIVIYVNETIKIRNSIYRPWASGLHVEVKAGVPRNKTTNPFSSTARAKYPRPPSVPTSTIMMTRRLIVIDYKSRWHRAAQRVHDMLAGHIGSKRVKSRFFKEHCPDFI